MSHMHRLLCSALLLFLLCCAYGCAAAAVVQPLPQKGQSILDAYTVAVSYPKKEATWKPIRIRVFPDGVNAWLKECTNHRGSMWGRGMPLFCTGDSRITAEKAKIIEDVVVEGAKLHTDRLRVQRVKGGVTPLDEHEGKYLNENCPGALSRPPHHKSGIKGGDFAVYVSPSVSHEEARICTNGTDGRPTSALIKVNTVTIKHTRHYVRLAAHDIAHGLGFMVPVFMDYNLVDQRNTPTGRRMAFMNSSVVLDKAKEHFGCPALDGLEFHVRDEAFFGYKWVAYPHWRRRFTKDELMSPYLDRPSGMYYTALTLAAFDSLPFYQADFSKAETMSWGRKKGCDFVQRNCVENETFINPEMYCTEESNEMSCTTDRRSLGKCSMKRLWSIDIPSYFDYFPRKPRGSPYSDWMDYCPVIEPTLKTSCEIGDENEMPGSLVSNISRCLDVQSLVLRKGGKSDVEGICAKVQCEGNVLKVQYKGNDRWHVCKDGNFIDDLKGDVLAGGVIFCPNYTDICGPNPGSKPASTPKPVPTPKPEGSPATGTSIGSNNESTSTTSNPQTETRVNGTETHEKQPVQPEHEAEKPHDDSQVSETPVTEENPAQTDSPTTGAGSHEEHQVPEDHEESEENEEHSDNGNEEHSDSGNEEHLDIGSEESDYDDDKEADNVSVLEAMYNDTINSQNRSAASNGQQGGSGGSQGARGNRHNTGETGIQLPENLGSVLDQVVRVINDKSTDSSIAASSIASLAVLVCVAAAVVAL